MVGPKLVNDNEYNWIHTSNSHMFWNIVRSCLEGRRFSGDLWQGEIRGINVEIN